MGSEEKLELAVGGVDGDDEPDGYGDDICGDEVELVGAVGGRRWNRRGTCSLCGVCSAWT